MRCKFLKIKQKLIYLKMDAIISCGCGGSYNVSTAWNHFRLSAHRKWEISEPGRMMNVIIICCYCYEQMPYREYTEHRRHHYKQKDIVMPMKCEYCEMILPKNEYKGHCESVHDAFETALKERVRNPEYANGVIYIIRCVNKSSDRVYIGSTCRFKKRVKDYEYALSSFERGNCVSQLYLYKHLSEHGGWCNWEMSVLEEYPCLDEISLVFRESYWIEQYPNALNNCLPIWHVRIPSHLNYPSLLWGKFAMDVFPFTFFEPCKHELNPYKEIYHDRFEKIDDIEITVDMETSDDDIEISDDIGTNDDDIEITLD